MKKIQSAGNFRIKAIYFSFIFIVVSVPLVFWKGLDNNFDLIKNALLYAASGVFFILTASLLRSEDYPKKNRAAVVIEKKIDLIFLLFVSSLIISAIFSLNPYVSVVGTYDRQSGLVTYLVIYILYIFSSVPLTEKSSIQRVLFAAETSVVIVAAYAIITYAGFDIFGLKPESFTRPFTPSGHPVFTAGIIILIFPFSALNIAGKSSKLIRFLYPLLMLAGLFFTQTRAAYAAAVLQILLLSFLYPSLKKNKSDFLRKNLRYILLVSGGVILFVIIALVVFPNNIFVKRIYSITALTEQPRWFLWRDSLRMLINYPLTGTGLGQFSNGFESFASYELKLAEVKVFFDNPHNNFLNIMCAVGIPGGLIYILLIVYLLYDSARNFRFKESLSRPFFLSAICCFSGYVIYGLADFDDNTIFLYLVIIISLYKHYKLNNVKDKQVFVNLMFRKPFKYAVSLLLLVFSAYIIYTAYLKISAEFSYADAKKFYSAGNYAGFEDEISSTISTMPEESHYRFNHAFFIFDNVTRHPEFPAGKKQILFNDAKQELRRCMRNYVSRNECLATLSFMELEQGNKEESERIKHELFASDTCQFKYRNNVARYYLKNGIDSMALYELNILLRWNPKNNEVLSTHVLYLEKNKLFKEAAEKCKLMLEISPSDRFAIEHMKKLYPYLSK